MRDTVKDSLMRTYKYLQEELLSPQPEQEYVDYLRKRLKELRSEYMKGWLGS